MMNVYPKEWLTKANSRSIMGDKYIYFIIKSKVDDAGQKTGLQMANQYF